YRASYDCSNMLDSTVWSAASRVNSNRNVSKWIAAAQKAHLGIIVCSKEQHLAELTRLKEIALEEHNIGAAVQCEQLRGKVQGYYKENVDITVSHDEADSYAALVSVFGEEVAKQIDQGMKKLN